MRATTNQDEFLAEIEEELAGVVALYEQLVEQSDKWADSMAYDRGYVLGKVFPKLASDRRCTGRFVIWFKNNCRSSLIDNFEERRKEIQKKEERERLLKSLNLTEAQKQLLFER